MRREKNTRKIDIEEHYRVLVKHFYQYAQGDKKCIAISSYIARQGKTKLVEEISTRLAEAGHKTLMVDCNILNPQLSKSYQQDKKVGILEAMKEINQKPEKISYKQLSKYIKATKTGNLYFCGRGDCLDESYNGPIYQKAIKSFFELLKQDYDYILLEVPSVNYLSLASDFIEGADGYLMSIKNGTIPIKEIPSLKEKVNYLSTKPLGAVFYQVEA